MRDRRELCAAHEAAKPVCLVWLPHVWSLWLAVCFIWAFRYGSMSCIACSLLITARFRTSRRPADDRTGHFINPLKLEPTARPPGSIIMSYPFGFSLDFRGFLFRSVFLPILSIGLAVYIVAGEETVREARWRVAAMTSLFSPCSIGLTGILNG
jgi:hypothetical protein